MKIVYVGDGRNRTNWGAQATSTALYDLLSVNNTVSAIIPSDLKLKKFGRLPVLTKALSGNKLFVKAKERKGRKGKLAYKILSVFGFKDDYISAIDAKQSVADFLKTKQYYPELQQIYDDVKNADAVVLNGEGSFILRTPPRRDALFLLFVLQLAKHLGKKAYCVNAMMSDCPVSGRNQETVKQLAAVYRECDGITLRDKYSYRFLKEIVPGLDCKYIPDALFSWSTLIGTGINLPSTGYLKTITSTEEAEKLDFTKPYILISGSSAAAWTKNQAIPPYLALVNKLKETGLPLYIIPTCEGDIFLEDVAKTTGIPVVPFKIDIKHGAAVLANAKVLVSGRFHPSIMASDGGTPCVFMGSNSHKTLTLQEVLEYPTPVEYNAIPSEADIENIFKDVQAILLEGDKRREAIKTTVAKLAAGTKELITLIK